MIKKPQTFKEKPADSRCQLTKAQMEEEVSVKAILEALDRAVLKGSVPHRKPSK